MNAAGFYPTTSFRPNWVVFTVTAAFAAAELAIAWVAAERWLTQPPDPGPGLQRPLPSEVAPSQPELTVRIKARRINTTAEDAAALYEDEVLTELYVRQPRPRPEERGRDTKLATHEGLRDKSP